MKLSPTFVLALLCAILVKALPANTTVSEGSDDNEEKIPVPCPDFQRAIPLFRAGNPQLRNHFYTTDYNEFWYMVMERKYLNDGYAGRLYDTHDRYTVPVYRLYNQWTYDHFYTTSEWERDDYISSRGYQYERVAGYILPSDICSGIPLFRLISRAKTHFYTTNPKERYEAVTYQGYAYEGILGYVQEMR
ncbi:hypothetical protein HGRIS_000777 [Hohenbuehelia grisea]|uniref:DUF5648 domain-containing protein n=1 Tax=Hohenbuehelia grisea TaxID=104357 RepID=A0ABR3IPR1_9AGAR